MDFYHSEDYKEAKELRRATSEGPMVILEGEDDDFDGYSGFSTFFIKVEDKSAFAKYSPVESLQQYNAKRCAVPIDKAVVKEDADDFDVAVLIAFPTAERGRAWLESEEYRPHGELRMATTTGPGAIIGKTNQQ